MKQAKKQPVHLQLLGNGSCHPFIGVHEVPGRLPELLRYPGESAGAFSERALHYVTGTGAIWARLMYASEQGHSKGVAPQGTPTTSPHTGNSHRVKKLAGKYSNR